MPKSKQIKSRTARAARFSDEEWQRLEDLRAYNGQESASSMLRHLVLRSYYRLPEEAKTKG